jgi:hypothetical protein
MIPFDEVEIGVNGELDLEDISGTGVETRIGSQDDLGRQGQEREGAEWSEEEMREGMDEWNRAVEARARTRTRTRIGIQDEQASNEGGGNDLDMS